MAKKSGDPTIREDAREARLSEALRANLRRRKAAQRKAVQTPPDTDEKHD